MSKEKALKTIDKELGVDGDGSPDYEALKSSMADWFSANELEQFAEHLIDENS